MFSAAAHGLHITICDWALQAFACCLRSTLECSVPGRDASLVSDVKVCKGRGE